MPPVILSAGLGHETNTFAVTPTTYDDFLALDDAEAIRRRFGATRTVHGGYLAAASERGFQLEPVFWAFATPSGLVQQPACNALVERLLTRLSAARSRHGCDGVLLDLHGAMASADLQDVEGHLIAAVRDAIGPQLPLVVTLDLHANVTAQMAAGADAIICFDEYPHTDMFERGREAGRLVHAAATGAVRPQLAYQQLPLITMPPRQCTIIDPARALLAAARALEGRDGVVHACIAHGFPFADIRDTGTSVLVTAASEQAAAAGAAHLAAAVWQRREQFRVPLTPVADALQYARERAQGLVVLADGSDNPGGGGPCDGTVVLQALVDEPLAGAVVAVIADPQVVAAAAAAGVGQALEAELGGKTDHRHGSPVSVRARVRLLSDGRFVQRGPMGAGMVAEMGRTAVLELLAAGSAETDAVTGVEVVVTERRVQPYDAELLRCLGIEPTTRRLIALKSAVHFRSTYQHIAERIFDLDTPGVHRPDFAGYDYRRLRPGVYPLDPHATFAAPASD